MSKRLVRSSTQVVVAPQSVAQVPVTFGDVLPDMGDYMFESTLHGDHSLHGYNHITDANFTMVQVRNDTDQPRVLEPFTRPGELSDGTRKAPTWWKPKVLKAWPPSTLAPTE
jgi:hypothetical protein